MILVVNHNRGPFDLGDWRQAIGQLPDGITDNTVI
jgi:hypothetical protein